VIHWIPDRLVNSCVYTTRKHRDSAISARNAGLSTAFLWPSTSARKLHSECESAMHVWHRRYVFGCVYAQLLVVAIQFDDAECPLSWIRYYTSPSSGFCLPQKRVPPRPHVRSEFEKESESGTSVASDPARDDSYNRHLMILTIGIWWQLHQKCSLISNCPCYCVNNALTHSNINRSGTKDHKQY